MNYEYITGKLNGNSDARKDPCPSSEKHIKTATHNSHASFANYYYVSFGVYPCILHIMFVSHISSYQLNVFLLICSSFKLGLNWASHLAFSYTK